MKRFDLVFASLLVPLDYAAVWLAGWAAYRLRFDAVTNLLPVGQPIAAETFTRMLWVVALGWVAVLGLAGVYAVRQRLSSELARLFLGSSTAVLLIIVIIFFEREFFASRFIILAGWLLAVVFLWVLHALARGVQRLLARQGIGIRHVVIIGNDQTTSDLLDTIHARPSLGLRLYKHFPEVTPETMAELAPLLKQGMIDEVVQADPSIPRQQTMLVIEACHEFNISFKYAADTFDSQARVEPDELAGIPVMALKRTPLDGWGRIFKRGLDVVGASLGFVLLVLPGLIVALLIKLDSSGPVFVRLERVGEGQRRFYLWKFRSMIRDAHALKTQLMDRNERNDGPLFKIKDDPRITRIGKWLRKTSIDEFPQLINVWRGEMSLVGPRPHEPEEVARYDRAHKKLLAIKPGMTGLAQVSGRSNLRFEDEVRLDTYYIEHWSLGLDLQILARTPAAVLNSRTAA